MTTELQSLQQQQQAEKDKQAQEHRQEQDRLLQQQHGQFQEQQNAFFRLQNEHQQDPTPQREHELLMLRQACQHTQEMFIQQQQHLLQQQQQELLRIQERHWHQEQLFLQQMQQHQQQRQQHVQQHSHSPISPFGQITPAGFVTESQQYFGAQQAGQHHQQHHFQQQPQPQHQQHHSHPHHHHHHHHQQQQQQRQPDEAGTADAMDIDDEVQLQSITSSIAHLRQSSPGPADIASSWAAVSASSFARKEGEEDPAAVVVLDTNILISHLNFLRVLIEAYGSGPLEKKRSTNALPRIVFVLPWVVIQELDGLKTSRRSGNEVNLNDKARQAIRYVQDELEKPEDERRLRGQKVSEAMDKHSLNDDYILDCCRYFKTVYPDEKKTRITLFSNDRNLCVKALIHDVKTLSHGKTAFEKEPVLHAILGIVPGQKCSPQAADPSGTAEDGENMLMDDDDDMEVGAPTGSTSSRPASKTSSGISIPKKDSKGNYRTEVNDREIQRIKSSSKVTRAPSGMDPKLFELTTHIIRNLRRYLEYSVPLHLKAAFGTDWRAITNFNATRVKDEDLEWDCRRLVQPLQLVQKYWRDVFSDLFGGPARSKKARVHFDQLQVFVKTWERVETFGLGKVYKKDLSSFLEDMEAVLAGVMIRPVRSAKSPEAMGGLPPVVSMEDPEGAKMYDAQSRIRLFKDWRNHCGALHD